MTYKQVRNDIWLSLYVRRRPSELDAYLAKVATLKGKNIAIVVAFEQPWALAWLLKMAKKNLQDTTVLVFDNSRRLSARDELKAVCEHLDAPYLPLPMNRTKHVNRSHGMAMSWIYENVIKTVAPKNVAFLDHDLIPVSPITLDDYVKGQPLFGRRGGKTPPYWSLWAGFSVFDFSFLKDKPINFLYDFSRGLDTGGRNWDSLFSTINPNQIRFAEKQYVTLQLPDSPMQAKVEILDGRWLHMGGISYNNGFTNRAQFYEALASYLDTHAEWQQLITSDAAK